MAREVKRAGSRKTVTAPNLESLGPERLAAILIDAADDDANLKRRLRMELAAEVGASDLAAEVAKRLTALEGRRSRVHWRKYKAFVRDLDLQRAMIAGPLAGLDARLALELIWRFLALADDLMERVNDERGEVAAVFEQAVTDLGDLVPRARPEPDALAERLTDMLEADYAQVLGGLVPAVAPHLDGEGLSALRARLQASLAGDGRRRPGVRTALQVVADAQGDVDLYVATLSVNETQHPFGGAQIARRMLAAGRTEEALAALARSAPPSGGRSLPPGGLEWEDAYLDALEADGQTELAQDLRWAAFEKRLSVERLRAYLKRLPDFDDVEAEDRAVAHARAFPNFTEALRFFVEWPAAGEAAALTLSRAAEIEPRAGVLEPAARLLEARHPLAATLLLRALIADTLRYGRAEYYKDAQRQLAEIASLAVQVGDWAGVEPHEDFIARMARLRRL